MGKVVTINLKAHRRDVRTRKLDRLRDHVFEVLRKNHVSRAYDAKIHQLVEDLRKEFDN